MLGILIRWLLRDRWLPLTTSGDVMSWPLSELSLGQIVQHYDILGWKGLRPEQLEYG